MSQVIAAHGAPVSITVDNGTEFASKAMDVWAYQYRVQLDFIRPGKPVENSYIESFNGRLRDECLNVEVFFTLADVPDKLERWRQDYNQVRPHSALGDRTPEEFARLSRQQWSEDSARTAGPANQLLAGAVQRVDSSIKKSKQLFDPPSDVKGGAEKLPSARAEQTAETTNLLEAVN